MTLYDGTKADRVVKFIQCLRHTKGKWRGQPFNLLPWQEKIIRDIFGTVNENGYRQYKTAYVEIPKKNGKTELAAAIALFLLLADGEQGAEVYSAAVDRMQASLVFNVAADMIRQSPALMRRCKILDSVKRIVVPSTGSFYQVLSSESRSKHGLNPSGIILDELHAFPNRDLYDVLTQGSTDARIQPLTVIITTAGDDPAGLSLGWELHKYAQDILNGVKEDHSFYPCIYALSESEDWHSEENWYKANPSLGYTISIEGMRLQYWQALGNPPREKIFRQFRLNQWVKVSSSKWVSLEHWDSCNGVIDPEALKGRLCCGGIDLSSRIDMTAFCLVFPPIENDPHWYVLWWYWLPEEGLRDRILQDHIPYDSWAEKGYLTLTPGNVIDYQFIEKTILKIRDIYNIRQIGFDPWNALQVSLDLADQGITMVEVRQGFKTLSPAMKELERLIMAKELVHGGNPIARWNFSNLEVKTDENGNIRPVKNKASGRIDGIIALLNALARAMLLKPQKPSVYEDSSITIWQ